MYHTSRSSIEQGQLVEDRLLPKPAEAGTRQTCIVRIPEKNQIFYYSIVAVDQVKQARLRMYLVAFKFPSL